MILKHTFELDKHFILITDMGLDSESLQVSLQVQIRYKPSHACSESGT